MYKYFKELERPKEFTSYLVLPGDYFEHKSYYDILFQNNNMKLLKDGTNRIIYNWPNSWYITPSGYLYNTGSGHKAGSLVYAYDHICDNFNQITPKDLHIISAQKTHNTNLTPINNQPHINDIIKRKYITQLEFNHYSHLDIFSISSNIEDNKSTQENLITLIIGHLAAETCLYNSFVRMNQSNHKKELISQIDQMDIKDILVKFAKFNKIETNLDRTITTSSLNGIKEFSEYLKKGWDLQIIPGIVYDQKLDKLTEVDFDSPIINKHLDAELNNYNGKGKVLIRHKNF